MPRKRPFLIATHSSHEISRPEFRRLANSTKVELMIEWFHQNFEDAKSRTPYDSEDTSVPWFWSGQYSATQALANKFEGLAADRILDQAADEIQAGGVLEWAKIGVRPNNRNKLKPWDPKLPTLDQIPDEAGSKYGSPEDYVARGAVKDALEEFGKTLPLEQSYGGIGHNQPPDIIEDEEDIKQRLGPVLQELRAEFGKTDPRVRAVKNATTRFRDVLIATGKWLWKKLDVATEEAAKAAGKAFGVALAASPFISVDFRIAALKLFHALMEWLMVVT
jgi:hypothetical protein